VEKLEPCDKNGASGKQWDIDGPERASVWENASQCEELTAIFVTILKRAKTLNGKPDVAAHPLRFPHPFLGQLATDKLCDPVHRGEQSIASLTVVDSFDPS